MGLLHNLLPLFDDNGRRRMFDAVRPGACFRSRTPSGLVETARVLSVSDDPSGISHVTYEMSLETASHERLDDRRTLTLSSFAARFGAPVESTPG